MCRQWRLILDPPMTGKDNMAKDISILKELSAGNCLPTLRLYRWSPPAVSLGYFQDENEVVNMEVCLENGIDVVRRPTGGRAVLHYDELTYSIVVPEDDPFIGKGGIMDVYRAISLGIVNAFNLLNIPAKLTVEGKRQLSIAAGSCFDTPSAYELQVDGKKVVGSAQLRHEGMVLQHGSIIFKLPIDLYNKVLKKGYRFDEGKKQEELGEKAAGLHDLNYDISYDQMSRALIRGFSTAIPAVFSVTEGV